MSFDRAWLSFALLGVACAPSYYGVNPASGAMVRVENHDVPASTSFSGAWRSPQIGLVTLTETPSDVSGTFAFERADLGCVVTGSLRGLRDGALLHFRWIENWSACPSGKSDIHGRGFFLYQAANHDQLLGSWGYWDNDRAGGQWFATRQ